MMHPVRTILSRAAALSAVGSGVYCFTTSSDHNASMSVSMPLPFRDSLAWSWRTMEGSGPFSSCIGFDHSHYGLTPLSFSRPDAVPDPNISKGVASDEGESPKHICNCPGRDTIANVAAKTGPAVVHLSVRGFFGMVAFGTGSGTIIEEDGTILTCAHLMTFASKVKVTLQDGREFEGTVVNVDWHADIAIVKIKSKTPLPTAKLGSSSKLRTGDWVVAMGYPLGLQKTVSVGIVSCVDRKASDLGLGGTHTEYLQTDCALNPGNSGGPLINADGEVIGVNFMKMGSTEGISFAVPADSVSKIIEQFKRNG